MSQYRNTGLGAGCSIQVPSRFSIASNFLCDSVRLLSLSNIPGVDPILGHTRPRLVKRRRALLESISSRNSQLETHPKDERGVGLVGRRLYRSDRFPHAFKTHQEKPPRSGILCILLRDGSWRFEPSPPPLYK